MVNEDENAYYVASLGVLEGVVGCAFTIGVVQCACFVDNSPQ